MTEYKRVRIFYLEHLEKLVLPRELPDKLMDDKERGRANVPGYIFLMTLYLAFANVYRRTHQDAEEVDIREHFRFIIYNKFERCPNDCTQCAQWLWVSEKGV
jgi:hypothetical protein